MQKFMRYRAAYFIPVLIAALISLCSFSKQHNCPVQPYKNSGDTTAFSANTGAGWTIHTSYLEDLGDSIEFELILFRTVPANTNWNDSSEVGTIAAAYIPAEERVIEYAEYLRVWQFTFRTDGKCFFQLLSGPAPEGEQIVLPVITKYKQ
jgi:hypothetical protein